LRERDNQIYFFQMVRLTGHADDWERVALPPELGSDAMSFHGSADSSQLAVLTRALEEHCHNSNILAGSPEQQEIARRVMMLFNAGTTGLEDIKQALARHSD